MRRVLLNRARSCPVDVMLARPMMAYSTRRLTRTYAGPCVNVRRSSDNATRDIYFAGDVLDAQAIYSFAGSGSAYVVTWYDQIGSINPTQATAANQPRILNAGSMETSGDKGIPAVRGITGSYLTKSASFSAWPEGAVQLVYTDRGSLASNTIQWQLAESPRMGTHLPYSGTIYFDWGGVGGVARVSVSTPAKFVANKPFVFTEANSVARNEKFMRLNGSTVVTGPGTNATPDRVNLFNDSALTVNTLGAIAEILFFNVTHTESNMRALEQNQMQTFGVY